MPKQLFLSKPLSKMMALCYVLVGYLAIFNPDEEKEEDLFGPNTIILSGFNGAIDQDSVEDFFEKKRGETIQGTTIDRKQNTLKIVF